MSLPFLLNHLVLLLRWSLRGYLCENLKHSFLPCLIFNWCTFSRWVTARWWRQSAKNQVSTNQNSRDKWCHIVTYYMLKLDFWMLLLLSLLYFSLIMLFSFTFTHVLLVICLNFFSYIQIKGNDVEDMVFCTKLSKVGKIGSYRHSAIEHK